jgi:hypothetical protein
VAAASVLVSAATLTVGRRPATPALAALNDEEAPSRAA